MKVTKDIGNDRSLVVKCACTWQKIFFYLGTFAVMLVFSSTVSCSNGV